MAITEKEVLHKANEILEKEGEVMGSEKSNAEILKEFILPGLQNSKDTLGAVYAFQSREREGFLGNLKTKLQMKIINTVVNVIEKQSMKQQKFNELTYKAIEALVKENEELKKKVKA